jgi:8-oxo-dGTP pyrophosphatase MutT (NUDIX family)
MVRRHGPWTIEAREQKYKNRWLEVVEDRVTMPDGKPGSFTTVEMRPGVSVLALDSDNFVYLTGEFRYAIGQDSVEVVSGAIDDDEEPLAAARRELKEEVGIEAKEWSALGLVNPFTSIVKSPAHLFLARNLSFTEVERESTEIIRTIKLKFDEAVEMVMESKITHGPSCVLILKALRHLA